MTRTLVLASGNPGKLREFQQLLPGWQDALRSLAEFPDVVLEEEGSEYEANARAKAACAAAGTGLVSLADDSGLEVDALDGAPGPLSARYGGAGLDDAGRCARLLSALGDVPAPARAARFVCVAALASPAGELVVTRGVCEGSILLAPQGDGGFGYDPIFQPAGWDAAMAQLAAADKNRISHRARAVAALLPTLGRWLPPTAQS